MTEMALIMPLLLLILAGLWTVGLAIWRYNVNLSYTRELARSAIREDGLNVGANTVDGIGYQKLIDHFAEISQADRFIDGDDFTLTFYIVSVYVGQPCNIQPCLADCILDPAAIYTGDDLTMTFHDRPEFFYQFGAMRPARDLSPIIADITRHDTRQECMRQMRDGARWRPTWDHSIIVESRYTYQPILWPQPIELRNKTQMRFNRVDQ